MKKRTKGVVVAVLGIVIIIGVWFVVPMRVIEMPVVITVGDRIGINLDKDKVYLGTTPPGTQIKRGISIVSEKEGRLFIEVEGITFVSPDRKRVDVKEGGQVSVMLVADVPANQELGMYEGKVKIVAKRVWKVLS